MIETDVEKMIIKEYVLFLTILKWFITTFLPPFSRKQQRAIEDERIRKAQLARRMKGNPRPFNNTFLNSLIPFALMSRRSMIVTTAFSIFVGICAYYYRAQAFNGAIR